MNGVSTYRYVLMEIYALSGCMLTCAPFYLPLSAQQRKLLRNPRTSPCNPSCLLRRCRRADNLCLVLYRLPYLPVSYRTNSLADRLGQGWSRDIPFILILIFTVDTVTLRINFRVTDGGFTLAGCFLVRVVVLTSLFVLGGLGW